MPAREPSRNATAARRRVLASLQEDHAAIAAAFAAVDALPPATAISTAQPLVDATLALLERHAQLEALVFYPAVRGLAGELVEEAEVEHASMASLVELIRAGDPRDVKYVARFKVLGEYLRHHVGEEEGALFARLDGAALPWVEIEARIVAMRAPEPKAQVPAAAPRKRAPRGGQKL